MGRISGLVLVLVLALGNAGTAAAQGLADYDYENLSFRGVALEGGYIMPDLVEPAYSVTGRLDLGFLGPGLRIVPFVSHWSSDLKRSEVAKLEEQVQRLIQSQDPGSGAPSVDLGRIDWSDLIVGVDGHFVFNVPLGFLTYAGAGAAAHILNGKGDAIDGTFVESLLDSVRAGINFHAGLERPLGQRIRLFTTGRYEILEDLQYFEVRLGGELTFGPGGSAGSPEGG